MKQGWDTDWCYYCCCAWQATVVVHWVVPVDGSMRMQGAVAMGAAMAVVNVAMEPAGSSWHVLVCGWRRDAAPMVVAGVEAAGSSEQVVQDPETAGRGGCQWEAMEAAEVVA